MVVVPNFFHLVNITNTGRRWFVQKHKHVLYRDLLVALLFALVLLLRPA